MNNTIEHTNGIQSMENFYGRLKPMKIDEQYIIDSVDAYEQKNVDKMITLALTESDGFWR